MVQAQLVVLVVLVLLHQLLELPSLVLAVVAVVVKTALHQEQVVQEAAETLALLAVT